MAGARSPLEFKGQKLVVSVFEALQSDRISLLPADAYAWFAVSGEVRVICDYVAGMTTISFSKPTTGYSVPEWAPYSTTLAVELEADGVALTPVPGRFALKPCLPQVRPQPSRWRMPKDNFPFLSCRAV
jgi:hypothetical protein